MKKPLVHTRNADGSTTVNAVVRVLLFRDGAQFVAQSLEVDYCAAGDSIEEAKENFLRGFAATIDLNLRKFGTLANMIEPAPAKYFQQFYAIADDFAPAPMDLPKRHARAPRRLDFYEGAALSPA